MLDYAIEALQDGMSLDDVLNEYELLTYEVEELIALNDELEAQDDE